MTGSVEKVGVELFDGERLRRPGKVAVGFLADWCPFCRAFEPEFRTLAGQDGATLLLADVTDEGSPLWERFGLDVVPTVIVFRDGRSVFRVDGVLGRGLGRADVEAVRNALRR